MKRGRVAGVLLGLGLILTGCGGFSPEMSGISIGKNGTVTEYVRENFEQSYYQEDELKNEINAQVENYNAEVGKKAVKKRSFKVRDGIASLRMTYDTVADFVKFNQLDFYMGDIMGAVQAGYPFEGRFFAVSAGKVQEEQPLWGSQIMSGSNYRTIALREAMLVKVPGTIRYVSEHVKVTDKSTAVIEEKQTAYILYE